MHQNAILLSSDQATILKKDQCSSITTTRIARIESPPPLSSASPQVLNQATLGEQHTTRIKSNNEFKPTDCQRGRLDDAVCKDDGQQHHEQRSYEIRPFVSEATDENEDKVAVRLREPAQASKAALETNNQDQQHHNQHLSLNHNNHNHNHHHHHNQHHQQQQQLFSLARLNPIKMEMTQTTTNQEQLASSQKQQQQKHQAQHRAAHQESLMDLLDTNSSQNQGQQQQPPSSAPTTGANNNEMISPVQNGPSTTGVVVDSISDQKASAFCAGCQAQIRDKFIFSVIDLFWHQDCVQCADCSLKLNDRCYTLNGKLYCKHDYWHRYGPKCFACQQSIEQSELVQRIKGNRVYHLKCFACHECRRPLEQGEQLHLMGDKRLLCKQDFQRLNNGCRLSASSCASGAGGGTGDGSGDASGDGGSGNGNANSGGQTKQDPNNGSGNGGSSSGNNNNNNGSVSYLTLLGSGSVKSAQGAASGAQKVSTGQQQKRSSLTSLDNTCAMSETLGQAGDVDSSACQTGETDLEPAELAGADDDDQTTFEEDEDGLVGPRGQQQQQRRREPLAGLDAEMLNDDDQSTGQFNEDENEENQLSRQHQAHMGTNVEHQQQLDELQAANSGCVKPIKQQQQQQGQQKNLLNPILPNGGIRKRRRRKQRLSIAGDKQQQQQAKSGNKLTSSGRNGESILNGSATSSQQQPASSILAGMQSATLDLDGASKQQQQLKSSCSTISSSSSSTSSSSNHSLSNSSTVTNHHHDQHYQQQHQQQQSASGATHRLATSSGLHHAHHHATLGATGNQQQQHQSGHHQSTGGSGGHKPTRVRTVLNEKQLQTLRDCYAQNPRPDALMKEQLVDMTGLSPRVIRVWFQNKRCKDKKKSILYKQMQQHEKDGRHLTGLTHIRGVPMVAASPVHYQDEHSSGAGNTPSLNATVGAPAGGNGGSGGGTGSGTGSLDPDSPQQIQQQQQQRRPSATVQSPPQSNQPIDIHAYQPPWKGLVEYAQQTPETPQQPDRLNASSPRYQQLIGQIHGYGASSVACDHQVGSELHPAQQQQQQQQYGGGPGAANVYSQSQPQPPPPPQPTQPPHHIQLQQQQQLIQQQQQQQHLHHHHHHHNQSNNHLHHNHLHHHHQPQQQHLAQVAAPMAGHHANQFQH